MSKVLKTFADGDDYYIDIPASTGVYVEVTISPTTLSSFQITLPEGSTILPSLSSDVIINESVEGTFEIYSIDSSELTPRTKVSFYVYTLPEALGGQAVFKSLEKPTSLVLNEKFSENNYDESWDSQGQDPDEVGSVSFDSTGLQVSWNDVPYSYKQKFPVDGPFGGINSYGEDGYLKNISIYLNGIGELSQDMATPYTEDDPQYGQYVPEVVYFGIQLEGREEGKSVYLALAHTDLPSGFTSGDIITGTSTTTKMIIVPDEPTLISLTDYNDFLGGGVTNVYMTGPSGLDIDNNFDSIVFNNPSSEADWIDVTDNTYWSPHNGYWSGDYWNDSPADMYLSTIGTWADDFRPTKVRITCDVGSPPLQVSIGTSSGGIGFAYDANYVSGTILDVNCTSDIERMNLYASGYTSGTKIYKIEFLI